ncbi:hypothetical protein [Sinomicrobium sp. M5D2P9]
MAWKSTKTNYSEIEHLISPTSVFHFNRTACDWVTEHNKNKHFYTYAGIHDKQFVLIVVPLDKDGKEVPLPSYLAIPLKPLDKELVLSEKKETVSVKRTTLSKDLEIKSVYNEIESSVYNEPTIPEGVSLKEVELWKNSCLDWFYHECTDYKGKRIFNTFTIPFVDLINGDNDYNKVICLFAFKDSSIYNRLIPVLIFVSVNNTSVQTQSMSSMADMYETEMTSNTMDWSQPCPPFCREEPDADVFS